MRVIRWVFYAAGVAVASCLVWATAALSFQVEADPLASDAQLAQIQSNMLLTLAIAVALVAMFVGSRERKTPAGH